MLGKMAAAVTTFACLVVLSNLQVYEATEVPHSQVNGIVHGTVYLNPKRSDPGKYKQITWWFNESLKILIKKWDQSESYPSGYFHTKLCYHENHTLEIKQLQKQDSSTYRMVVEDSQSQETSESIRLDVYGTTEAAHQGIWWILHHSRSPHHDPIPKPSVNVASSVNKDGWCNVTLACIVAATQVTYRWRKNEEDLVSKISSTLDVQLKSGSDASYKCIVSNPASEETGLIYYRSPCTWNEKNSAVPLSLAQQTADSILAFGLLLLVHNWV
ncbi:CD48 antigen [Pangshura tecta]